MSRPPINPEKSTAGIAVDPRTLERVIPESRRPDGSVRKQLKVRPGFTPQEDVKRFRGTRQAQMDANTLPKGHIIGWVPPSSAVQPSKHLSKSAKKNAKRKEKREKEAPVVTRKNWEDDNDEEDDNLVSDTSQGTPTGTSDSVKTGTPPNANKPGRKDVEQLASDLERLNVK